MKRRLAASCIDINSPYCPCLLAETNHCVFCSHLKGQETCDCNWSGVCILYERRWQPKNSVAGRDEQPPLRMEEETALTRKELIATDTYLLEFSVGANLAAELKKTGAFVFLRLAADPQYFHFPVGIMKMNGSAVQVVVEAVGPKSRRLIDAAGGEVVVRGPYYNGVLGQPWIDNITCGTILLIAGGMGQPPALPIAARLTADGNRVIALLAPGKTGRVFIEDDLRAMGVTVHTVDSFRRTGAGMLTRWLADAGTHPDLVVSAGPDDQHYSVIAAMQTAGVNIPMAATNNATLCCGEGICGSCERETNDDRRIRLCKVQTDFSQLAP
jgi:2-polyprenylphenol hydroxylase and related flavodoxin oxidoreductases